VTVTTTFATLLQGNGYEVHFVAGDDPASVHQAFAATLDRCRAEARNELAVLRGELRGELRVLSGAIRGGVLVCAR
jgi:phosphoketolase